MADPVLDRARTYHDELTAIRRDIHAHPELGLEEHRTAELVARKLEAWGIEVHRGVGGTGVVGVLRNGDGPAIGLRADMDALPMEEQTNLPYSSRNPGRMHACGHDGHTTMLLGAARYLAETRNFNGTVNFIFQPGEEGVGGALAMLEDGLFERFPCEAIFGMHNRPGMPVGQFAITLRPGDGRRRVLRHRHHRQGRARRPAGGAHRPGAGRLPHRRGAAVDRVAQRAAAGHGGAQRHAHPGRRRLQRDPADRDDGRHRPRLQRRDDATVEANMQRLAGSIAAGFGADGEGGFPRDLRAAGEPRRPDARLSPTPRRNWWARRRSTATSRPPMASEDFSFMLEKVPGAYINLGNGEDSAPVHNPAYNFNDAAIPYGVALYARLTERQLGKAG